MTSTDVTLMVTTEDQATAARAVEHFARAAAGLAMDGVSATLMFGPTPKEDDDAPY